MRRKSILFSILAIGLILLLQGLAAGAEPGRRSYAELVDALKNGDKSVNFMELRLSYARTKYYDPYGTFTDRDRMLEALDQKKYQDAITYSNEILKTNFTDIDAHMIAALAYEQVNEPEKSRFHRFMGKGLMLSIFNSCDGKSPGTAWLVIDTREEYIILSALRLRGRQALVNVDGHDYDKFTIIDPGPEGPSELYFNIDIPFHWLQDRFHRRE